MSDLGTRIFRLLKTAGQEVSDRLEEKMKEGPGKLEEELREQEKAYGFSEESPWEETSGSQWPKELVDDLAVFGLIPPSSLEEVKSRRNKEVKKYHPDRFHGEPEKLETAKQILQIYNDAYERLERRFK